MTTYRVMAVQETGEEVCIASNLSKSEAERRLDESQERYAEWSGFHLEREESRFRNARDGEGYY